MYNTILQKPNFYKVGIYIRLSEVDEDKNYESESESIINQRKLLMDCIKQCGYSFIEEYVDDGYTGTNFDRPGFKKMIGDIESGKINCIITKDLSRLGRDYIKCGYYVEEYFPSKNVRYISILDNIDTFLETANNDIAPFKALFNDMFSKDTSKKIRSILKSKKEQGKFIGSEPSYGYMRNPEDKGKLITNPLYAHIVKKIFELASSGTSVGEIVNYLNENHIKTPSAVKRKDLNSKNKYNPLWTISSVSKILKNRMYTGDMVQNVQTKLSYKSKKKVVLNKDYWIIVPNTHEPLVSKDIFERVQKKQKSSKNTFKKREKRLFENLLFCKECGSTLTLTHKKSKNYWTINCNKYSRDPRSRFCEPHFMPYDKLEKALLITVKKTYTKHFNDFDIELLAKEINNRNKEKKDTLIEQKILNQKISEYIKKIDMLYDDKFRGNISLSTYKRLSTETEHLLNSSELKLKELKHSNGTNIDYEKELMKYRKQIIKLTSVEEFTRIFLQSFIEKIVIDKKKNIEIFYKFKKTY